MDKATILSNQEWQKGVKKELRLRWVMWGTAIISYLLIVFHRSTGGPIADKLMAAFNMSATAFGNLQSMFFYIYGAMQIPAGILADYMGPRKTVMLGSLISSIGAIIFGLAPSVFALYLGRFFIGLGSSVIYVNTLKILTEWFPGRQFAMMTSITLVMSSMGTMLATTPLALLVSWGGWRLPFEIVGPLGLIAALACRLIIRDRPRDLGLPSPVEIERHQQGTTASPSSSGTPAISLGRGLKMVIGNKHTWPLLMVSMGSYGTFLLFTSTWGIPYLMQSYYMVRSEAANYLLVASIGAMLGSLTTAHVSDRLMKKRRPPLIIWLSTYFALWLVLTFWNGGRPPVQVLYPLFLLMGCSGGVMVVIFACVRERNHPSLPGIALGVVNLGSFSATAVLQPLFGAALDFRWQGAMVEGARVYPVAAYQLAFTLVCTVVLVAVIGAFLTRETGCRNVYRDH